MNRTFSIETHAGKQAIDVTDEVLALLKPSGGGSN